MLTAPSGSTVELCTQPNVCFLYDIIHTDQFLCVNVNNGNASLTASNISNPYVLSLKDIHNNVQSSHIVLGGLSNIDPIDSSFTIQIIGSTTTQYAFALGIQGSSAYSKMQFFLLLIGTEAVGYI